MNQKAETYWNEVWNDSEQPKSVSAWQFGFNPDELAQLVINGVKTATCSAYIFYEQENTPLPAVDDYSVILNSKDDTINSLSQKK